MNRWRRFIRSIAFLLIFLLSALWTKTLFGIIFLILSIFYFVMDVCFAREKKTENKDQVKNYAGPLGVLGDYIVDATESYGLFLDLLDAPVFVDIRYDEFIERRKQRAIYLFDHQKELEVNFIKFVDKNPEFKTKRITYIGLHYPKNFERGEVFWNPDGYTLLYGLEFVLEPRRGE